MRKPRFLLPPGGVYHVTTHALETGTKTYPFPEQEQERMVRLLKPMSKFTGVNVLTYAFMGNHLHLMLEIPERPSVISEKDVIIRLNALPKAPSAKRRPGDQLAFELSVIRGNGGSENRVEQRLNRIRSRMYDLSRFMQEYLSRYTQAYNRRHDRKGPLWQERFHSVAVQAHRQSLLSVAAYIDLNPLRAGRCQDPKAYRFTGYSAALAGDDFAMRGLHRLFQLCHLNDSDVLTREPLALYRVMLFGEAGRNVDGKASLTPEQVAEIKTVGGELGMIEILQHRKNFLTRGGILGTRIFIEDQVTRWKECCGLKKHPSPRREAPTEELHYVHPLRVPL